ncbi:PREDICTED: inositol 1,4,5-trisphosphate receptor-interacting protein-like 1, partial [Buceros rhinoceros silvestris]|uniref:inositol 1,4,5-trisphosphate receptor-interacting protein-like 1 n=1 Tax=Buceros rhinoceros silvestris TaxID=175836 RepID=UPI000528D393
LIAFVHDVVDELLHKCQEQSKKDFFPVLQTPFSIRQDFEDPSHLQYFGIRVLIMPVKAPRGHSFHLVPGTTGEVQDCTIRVGLECTCEKEQLDEDMLCFLHHPKEELSRNQPPSLLDTLCTGSYLDLAKTSHWFKKLVKSSWKALPDVKGCRLTVLPTKRLCRLQLTCTANVTLLVEMVLAAEQG